MLFFSCCKPIHQPAERPAESQDRESGSLKTLDVDISRRVKERRILQRAPLQITADGKTCTGSSRSLFEASAYRVATHEERARQQLNQPDEDHQGIPQLFLDACLCFARRKYTVSAELLCEFVVAQVNG